MDPDPKQWSANFEQRFGCLFSAHAGNPQDVEVWPHQAGEVSALSPGLLRYTAASKAGTQGTEPPHFGNLVPANYLIFIRSCLQGFGSGCGSVLDQFSQSCSFRIRI